MLTIEKDYCKTAIDKLEANKFVLESPPKFYEKNVAEAFVKDAIKIGFADKNLHLFELNWLKFVAEANNLDKNWCILQLQEYLDIPSEAEILADELEVNKLLNVENPG